MTRWDVAFYTLAVCACVALVIYGPELGATLLNYLRALR